MIQGLIFLYMSGINFYQPAIFKRGGNLYYEAEVFSLLVTDPNGWPIL